ncbi:hypothetical protein PLANPX_3900 [Lacipirellula parvula]|uniref:Uncharacterized protein n=1 Tax=Lacipirellula parvula TaxID=2650471 RepID=A0A5K7XCU9_9BACT|nr:hypothetical protein PLANPX_3900 [Lacipirellula parvula]
MSHHSPFRERVNTFFLKTVFAGDVGSYRRGVEKINRT